MSSRALADAVSEHGLDDPTVLEAIARVPRHLFLPEHVEDYAYEDEAVPIGDGQSASQPFILGRMLELAQVHDGERVLEIGAGSGYLTALLEELGARVWAIERSPRLANTARETLKHLEYTAQVRTGDGARGWPEQAPFDLIISGVAVNEPPPAWLEQLAPTGRIVAPIGRVHQRLAVLERQEDSLERTLDLPVSFSSLLT